MDVKLLIKLSSILKLKKKIFGCINRSPVLTLTIIAHNSYEYICGVTKVGLETLQYLIFFSICFDK